jgi:predicted RNA-binding protein with PIN domain
MSYLIDGHNLIPKIPGLSLQDIDDERELIKVLRDFCRKRGKKIDVYFDNAPPGRPQTQKYGRVTAHFIRRGRTADAAIQSRLRKLGRAARNVTVVTSDRVVITASKKAGAKVISSEDFSRRLTLSGEKEIQAPETNPDLSLNPDDIDEWMRLFGINGEDGSSKGRNKRQTK